jgi:hypothetical protein
LNAETNTANPRRLVLALVDALGNVSEAMTRAQFYEFKRRFHTQGVQGLKGLANHPTITPPVKEAV